MAWNIFPFPFFAANFTSRIRFLLMLFSRSPFGLKFITNFIDFRSAVENEKFPTWKVKKQYLCLWTFSHQLQSRAPNIRWRVQVLSIIRMTSYTCNFYGAQRGKSNGVIMYARCRRIDNFLLRIDFHSFFLNRAWRIWEHEPLMKLIEWKLHEKF